MSKGQPVCVVETTKASIEVESPAEGWLCQLVRQGEEVELGGRIAFVAESEQELAAVEQPADPGPPPGEGQGAPKATKKAVELAQRYGLDLASIAKDGFITAEEVEAAAALLRAGSEPEPAPDPDRVLTAGASTEGVSLPAHFGLEGSIGRLDESFLDSLRADPDAFCALSSEERCAAYRANGARIGERVTLGARTLIDAPRIVLDDGVVFGDDCTVRCEEVVAVGPLTRFGTGLRLTCRRAYVGSNGWVGDRVQIGGGGARDPWGTFAAGDHLFVGDEVFVNPCRPVLIGREVFLTMRSVIVTHNIGHSLLEGFENRFAPVVVEDRAQVGIGTVVYAGCRIGREAIVGSNSYVVTNVPPGKLAVGVPAKVAGSASHPPSRDRQARLLSTIVDDLHELLELRGVEAVPVEGGSARGIEVRHDGQTSLVLAVERLAGGFRPPETGGETVLLTLELVGDPPPGCAVLDLLGRRVHGDPGILADSVREFCRKRGVRFEPTPWRYTGGLV